MRKRVSSSIVSSIRRDEQDPCHRLDSGPSGSHSKSCVQCDTALEQQLEQPPIPHAVVLTAHRFRVVPLAPLLTGRGKGCLGEGPGYFKTLPLRRGEALAEEKGFEPLVPCGTAVFKTAAFDHSATPPCSCFGAEIFTRGQGESSCADSRGREPIEPRKVRNTGAHLTIVHRGSANSGAWVPTRASRPLGEGPGGPSFQPEDPQGIHRVDTPIRQVSRSPPA